MSKMYTSRANWAGINLTCPHRPVYMTKQIKKFRFCVFFDIQINYFTYKCRNFVSYKHSPPLKIANLWPARVFKVELQNCCPYTHVPFTRCVIIWAYMRGWPWRKSVSQPDCIITLLQFNLFSNGAKFLQALKWPESLDLIIEPLLQNRCMNMWFDLMDSLRPEK